VTLVDDSTEGVLVRFPGQNLSIKLSQYDSQLTRAMLITAGALQRPTAPALRDAGASPDISRPAAPWAAPSRPPMVGAVRRPPMLRRTPRQASGRDRSGAVAGGSVGGVLNVVADQQLDIQKQYEDDITNKILMIRGRMSLLDPNDEASRNPFLDEIAQLSEELLTVASGRLVSYITYLLRIT